MSDQAEFSIAPSAHAPVASVRLTEPKTLTDCSKCEGNVNIGVFFDGTNNNADRDEPKLGDSNVVRLYRAYRRRPKEWYYKLYLPGVGTRFSEIGEDGESFTGNGFAHGCEQRVLFAMCWMLEYIHRAAFDDAEFLSDGQIAALSRNQAGMTVKWPTDQVALMQLGERGGLRMPDTFGDGDREEILKRLAVKLKKKLSTSKVRVKECFVNVFGFSRGAAQARVFCNWMDRLCINGELAGVKITFRFLGIMDTVASAGFVSSIGSALGFDGGHSGWADADYLLIRESVKSCVHMVAMHELRRNFPVDTVIANGRLPPNCVEHAYPGAHSDIGGGYAPGELGMGVGKTLADGDALKLSQVPLNHLLACALKAGSPLNQSEAKSSMGHNLFKIDPMLQRAYDDFILETQTHARPLHQWLQPYINWKWEISKRLESQGHWKKATAKDRELLRAYNEMLLNHAAYMDSAGSSKRFYFEIAKRFFPALNGLTPQLDPEARSVYAAAKAAPATSPVAHAMFDGYVHDSLAGFDRKLIEWTGYWRYRKGFLGSRKGLIAAVDENPEKPASSYA